MSDDMLKKVEALGTKSVSRRSFLRGGAIAAAVIGATAALPAALRAQEPTQNPPDKQDKKDDKKQDPDQASSEQDPDTKTDSEGREYRECPQCGSNMYRQGRTWTCENCGYSYVE
jgi:ribosomal protein S27AE